MNVHRQTPQQSFCFDSFPGKNSELQLEVIATHSIVPGCFGFCGFNGNFVVLCYPDLTLPLSDLQSRCKMQEELCLVKKRF
jgi:hypothetical protein